MNKPRPIVLIGDSDLARREMFREVLQSEFLAVVHFAVTWDEMRALVSHHASTRLAFALVADDLPDSHHRKLPKQVHEMLTVLHADTYLSYAEIGFISTQPKDDEPVPDKRARCCVLQSSAEAAAARAELTRYFSSRLDPAPVPPVLDLHEHDETLILQVSYLHGERKFNEGMKTLAFICREFFECDRLTIQRLAQGLSGASVFRVAGNFTEQGGWRKREFVLKLSLALNDGWKLDYEATGHERAAATLGFPGIKSHAPHIVKVQVESNDISAGGRNRSHDPKSVVRMDKYCAICYGFLGGELGPMLELERALTENSEELKAVCEGTRSTVSDYQETFRIESLNNVLLWLCDQWYAHKDKNVREEMRPWTTVDVPEKEYRPFPPYALTGKTRRLIEAFLLSGWDGLGPKLLPQWATLSQSIRQMLIANDRTGIPLLDREMNCLLSPAHGDLNTKNIFLWLNQPSHPFLIDFPFFQERGHALQDFARLEVEIMMAVLDRQDIPGVPDALDYTHSQLPLWTTWLDHLLAAEVPTERTEWNVPAATASANLCLKFVRVIRDRAVEVQKQRPADPMPSFFAEYLPALLYHTVRAIRYDTISPFKRLLAVHGAGQIIRKLKTIQIPD